ncbi:MAG TPA: hypothetical protein PLQ76_03735 [bacterium]|nr:hypothetical protein [bacterium]
MAIFGRKRTVAAKAREPKPAPPAKVKNPAAMQDPLVVLLSHVSDRVGSETASNPATVGLDLSRVFKESLELLPYQKTASSMNPSLAAQKIVNLVKNIYTATCRLRPPESATARANLFLSVHNSANRGFIDARDALEAENAFSKDIERTYVHTQWLSHQALNNYLGFINSGKELPEAELTGMDGASPDQRPRSAGNDGARPLVKNDGAAPPPQQHLKPLGNSGIWNRFNSIISYSRQKYSRH